MSPAAGARRISWIGAVSILLATACGGTTLGGETEAEFRDRMVEALMADEGLDDERASCVVDDFLETFDEARLVQLSNDPEDLTPAETETFLVLLESCDAGGVLDPFEGVTSALAGRYSLDDDETACFITAATDELGWARLAAIAQIRPPTEDEALAIDLVLQTCRG